MSATINQAVYITVNRKFDGKIRVSYSKTEIVDCVDDIEHNIIREALKLVGIESAVEVVYMADLPMGEGGSGLGSSSALAVGVLKALYALCDQHVTAEKLATEAFHIERNILGHPVGKQDHYAAAYGGLNYIQFRPDGSVFVDPVICDVSTKTILARDLKLYYTGLSRISSVVLGDQVKTINDKLAFYERLTSLADSFLYSLHSGDLSGCYEHIREGWIIKKSLSGEISNGQIDDWYQAAMDAGANAGKIAGAGAGGFMMFMCNPDRIESVSRALPGLKMIDVDFDPQGSRIVHLS
ncbi:hypothetical protein N9M22_05555 [Litoricolaceae bacterium]|nr:hypothetical protein [Litorivicinaceae bacterium]